jgi:dissimilatory sulfite reductase (desulfoviridin) alpha/beta subunit
MARPRHPDKDIEAAVRYAESRGWAFVRTGSHVWGVLHCAGTGRGACRFHVYSTPRNPTGHARDLRRDVDRCHHTTATGDPP